MRVLLLGIGNILFGDEGFGVHFAHSIKKNYSFVGEHSVDVIDGGTLAHALIPLFVEYDFVIVFDCLENTQAKEGDVFFFDFKEFLQNNGSISFNGSAHEVEMLQTLQMIDMMGDLPPTKILAIKPKRIDTDPTFNLSPELLEGAKVAEQKLVEFLATLDIKAYKSNNYDLQELALVSYRGF